MTRDNNKIIFFLLVCFLFVSPNQLQTTDLKELSTPKPKKQAVKFEAHGVVRIDDYYWMRDDSRKNEEVLSHLKSENKYLEDWFKEGTDKRDQLFEEIISKIPKKEDSVPIPMGSYEYYRRYEPENEHAIYIRKKIKSNKEEFILDVNELAKSSDFYQLANWSISPSENLIAIAEDTTGRREYKLRIKDLSSNKFLLDRLLGLSLIHI